MSISNRVWWVHKKYDSQGWVSMRYCCRWSIGMWLSDMWLIWWWLGTLQDRAVRHIEFSLWEWWLQIHSATCDLRTQQETDGQFNLAMVSQLQACTEVECNHIIQTLKSSQLLILFLWYSWRQERQTVYLLCDQYQCHDAYCYFICLRLIEENIPRVMTG